MGKRKSHVKSPHTRTAHYCTYWYYQRDLSGDIIYDKNGIHLKEKRKKWLADINIHADGMPMLPEEIKSEEIKSETPKNKEETKMLNTYTNPNGRTLRRGEIYYVKKSPVIGSEQEAGRPALIVSNNAFNATSQTVELVYLTTQPKRPMKEHIPCTATGLASTILCEQICTASIERVGDYVTTLTPDEMAKVDVALMYSLSLEAYIPYETIDGYKESVHDTSKSSTSIDTAEIEKMKEALKRKEEALKRKDDELKTMQAEITALKNAVKTAEAMADKATSELMELKQSSMNAILERNFYEQQYNKLMDRVIK